MNKFLQRAEELYVSVAEEGAQYWLGGTIAFLIVAIIHFS